jgi:hypothetical protein
VSIPELVRSCRGSGTDAGPRLVVPGATSYDITQCDFHTVGLSLVFINSRSLAFVAYGMELSDTSYVLVGIVVVVLVSCITQSIVSILGERRGGAGKSGQEDQQNRPARGDVCFISCIAGLSLVLFTSGWSPAQYLVTEEEVVAFWYMSAYCIARSGTHPTPPHAHTLDNQGRQPRSTTKVDN